VCVCVTAFFWPCVHVFQCMGCVCVCVCVCEHVCVCVCVCACVCICVCACVCVCVCVCVTSSNALCPDSRHAVFSTGELGAQRSTSVKRVTTVLQMSHISVLRVSEECYRSLTHVLQECHKSGT
jgi:hypothetical protein